MPRPRKDGTPARPKNKRKLSEVYLQRVRPQPHPFLVWDDKQSGLALQVRPSGHKAWKFIYSFHGRVRWYHIGDACAWDLKEARAEARALAVKVDREKDPQAEKRAKRSAGTFEELAEHYRDEYAKKENRSWRQADYLVRKHLLPKWGKLLSASITRADVKTMMRSIKAPVVANQTLAAASAIFTWAIEQEIGGVVVHPCKGVHQNKVQSRERILSDSEFPRFWAAFNKAGLAGTALKLILLLGQRPGEVKQMRSEHIVDGWWELPGNPVPSLGWPGTKNERNHRVWLPREARDLLPEAEGYLLADARGRPVNHLDQVMRSICAELGVNDKVTPHDLRRTHGTKITALGFGRDAMNRIQNHIEGGIGSVYDRHRYAEENKRIMEAVAAHILAVVEGRPPAQNVVPLRA
jgi:integrase